MNVRRSYCKTPRAQHTLYDWHQWQNAEAATAYVSSVSKSPGGTALCRWISRHESWTLERSSSQVSLRPGVRDDARALRYMPVMRRSKSDLECICVCNVHLRWVSLFKGVSRVRVQGIVRRGWPCTRPMYDREWNFTPKCFKD